MSIQTLIRANGDKSYRSTLWIRPGKRITKTFRKLGEAREWEKEMLGNKKAAASFANNYARTKTLADLCDAYMGDYQGKDRSIENRLAWWKTHHGYRKLNEISTALINDALRGLAKGNAERYQGKEKGAKALDKVRSPATVNRYHQALSSALSWGVREGWLVENLAKQTARKKESRGRVRYLSDAERAALLKACDESKWDGLGLVSRLALSTGARLGEIMGLRWQDIDLGRGTATLSDTKNGETRVLPLVQYTRDALKTWSKVRRLDTDLLFASPNKDKPFHFRQHWEQAVRDAGIEDFRFHDLRHSCASYLAMAGASHLEIAEVLGHKTLAMVKRYSHLNHEHKADLLERVTGGLLGD